MDVFHLHIWGSHQKCAHLDVGCFKKDMFLFNVVHQTCDNMQESELASMEETQRDDRLHSVALFQASKWDKNMCVVGNGKKMIMYFAGRNVQ